MLIDGAGPGPVTPPIEPPSSFSPSERFSHPVEARDTLPLASHRRLGFHAATGSLRARSRGRSSWEPRSRGWGPKRGADRRWRGSVCRATGRSLVSRSVRALRSRRAFSTRIRRATRPIPPPCCHLAVPYFRSSVLPSVRVLCGIVSRFRA